MNVPADNPIKDASEDQLGRLGVASVIAGEIRQLDASQGFVVGILGPWGSGKTSLVNLVRGELTEKPPLAVLDFNPWMFSGAEELVQSFFLEVGAQFRSRGDRLSELADDLVAYGEVLGPLRLLPVVGVWVERARTVAASTRKALKRREEGALARRDRLSERLAELHAPVVIVVDDIDRLRTSEIRDVFKLVRLTAHFPNVVYLLAFDRHRVERALSEEGLVGRDYLEKILQVTYDIPTAPEGALTRRLTEAIDAALSDVDDVGPFDASAWPDVLLEVVLPLIRNMRDVRRYVASMHGTVIGLDGRIALVDILGLEAVRVFLPDAFAALVAAQAGLTTTSPRGLGQSQSAELKAPIESLIAAGAPHDVVVRAMITRLFPAGRRHFENSSYGSDWLKRWLRDRRVAHADILKLYLERVAGNQLEAFYLAEQIVGVLDDQDSVAAALDELTGEALGDVIAALEIYEDEFSVESVRPASVVLLNQTHRVPERSGGFFGVRGDIIVSRVVLRLLKRLPGEAETEAAVRAILPQVVQLSDRWDLIRLVGHREDSGHKLISDTAAAELEREFRDRVRAATTSQLANERELMRLALWTREEAASHAEDSFELPESIDLDIQLLKACVSDVRSQGFDTRAVSTRKQLFWDPLVELRAGEDGVRQMLDRVRPRANADESLAELIELAQKYLDGWRPKRFPGADDA